MNLLGPFKKLQRLLPLTYRKTSPERLVDLGKMVQLPPGFFPTNPSVVKIGEDFLICVRGVNYTLEDARSMRPKFSDPAMTGANGFHTLNRFFLLGPDLVKKRDLPLLDDASINIEDIKLFTFRGEIYGIGSRVIDHAENSCLIALIHIRSDFESTSYREISSPFGLRQEKNWSPFIHEDELYFVYSYDPLVILKYDFENGTVGFCRPEQADYPPEALPFLVCGSSPGLETPEGYLFVAHRRSVRLPSLRRAYMSRLYRLNRHMSVIAGGPYFVIDRPAIQFVNGLVLDGEQVYVTYGNEDRSAHLAAFPANALLQEVA